MSEKIINIGILTPFLEGYYFGGLIKSIHNVTKKLGCRLYVVQTTVHKQPSDNSGYDYPLAFYDVDGWIVLPQAVEDSFIDVILKENKPVVLVSREINNSKCSYIMPDNFNSTKQATRHLISHGHKDIAFVGCFKIADVRERFDGYLAALKEHGLEYKPELVFDVFNAMQSGGREGAAQIIDSGTPCTAVLASTDANAFGIMEALNDAGYLIPEDIAVFGYDDNEFSKTTNPPLSTIRQSIEKVGGTAVKCLLKQITTAINPETIFVKSDLVIRQSCGCNRDAVLQRYTLKENKSDYVRKKDFKPFIRTIISSYKILGNIAKSDFTEIKNLSWLSLTSFNWGCLGFWTDNYNSLTIEQFYDKNNAISTTDKITCSAKNFPPVEFLPDADNFDANDIIWLHPIYTKSNKLAIISLIGPISKYYKLTNCDTVTHYFDLLAFALEYELKEHLPERIEVPETSISVSQFLKRHYKDFFIQKHMLETFLEDFSVLREISSNSFFDNDNLLYYIFKKIEKEALSILSPVECNIFLIELGKLKQKNIKQLFRHYSEYSLAYSESINKQLLPFDVQSDDILVDPDIYNNFCKSLVHVFTSMLNHSLEYPDERSGKGKNKYGTILCKASISNNILYMELSDDGKGLDENSTPDFKAVEIECTKLGGKLEVESNKGTGTTFRITLPYQKTAIFKTLSAINIFDPVIRKTTDLFVNDYGLKLLDTNSFKPKKAKRIPIKDITTTLNIKGILNYKLAITVNENLGRTLVKKYIFEELTPENELNYSKAVLSECINIIMGNSIQSIDEDLESLLFVETPMTIQSQNCFVRCPDCDMWVYNMDFEEGKLTLGFIYQIDIDDNMVIE
ncbi:MAG: putative HTH-type transcriptional repressor ExuR [Firmicutes bacterium ADurb.Bin419]|nr:MAG: putative HTH-type transcriptional repressor ExuR [Firmicutes bacterium ADurb.Bin419]